jgi:glycosyltransferase involved in cell wall biosynthesis
VKICLLANADSVHTRRWVGPLLERGHEVSILSYATVERLFEGVETVDLTEINNTPRLRFLVWAWWVRRYIRRTKPDLINALQLQAAGWVGVLSRFHPLVVTALGSDLLLETGRSRFRRRLTRLVFDACDRLTVPSQVMFDAACRLGCPAEKVVVVPWGVETEIFRPGSDNRQRTCQELGIPLEAPVVLCPRAVRPIYNQDVLVAALSQLVVTAPAIRLLLLRYNVQRDYLEFLEEKISERGLQENVIWLEPRSWPGGMARLYRLADVVVSIPSSEGYGLTVREALATGTATIISDLPVFERDLIDESHVLKVGLRSVEQTREALDRLISDPAFRARLSANALEIAANYDASSRVTQTVKLYEECVAQAAASRILR